MMERYAPPRRRGERRYRSRTCALRPFRYSEETLSDQDGEWDNQLTTQTGKRQLEDDACAESFADC